MTGNEVTVVPRATYRSDRPDPFCPGCGHGGILDHLDRALVKLQLDPRTTVIVSDVGCVGFSDQYFETNTFHGLRGRSIAYAAGIKLASPELRVIVTIGDGGCGIGAAHLLSAARRNIGLTVLVFDNMSCGTASRTHGGLPLPGETGGLERPIDLCATAAVNGAGYVYRGTVFDADLADRIAEAIEHRGFSLLDVWEPCTATDAPAAAFSRQAVEGTLAALGLPTGVLHREERPEYARALRRHASAGLAGAPGPSRAVAPRFASRLDRRVDLVLAGSAGGKVRSAARLLGLAGVLSGLHAAQRDDYPVTVKTGHSLSEIVLSPTAIDYPAVTRADALVVVTPEGLEKVGRALAGLQPEARVFLAPDLAHAETPGRKTVIDLEAAGARLPGSGKALAMLAAVALDLDVVGLEALEAAAREGTPGWAEDSLRAVAAGAAWHAARRPGREEGREP